MYFVKAGGVLIEPSVYALQAPSLAELKIDFEAADGSTYSLATDVMNATFTTDITSSSTSTVLREAEAFEVTIKQRISKSSFSEFQSKLQVEIRKGEQWDYDILFRSRLKTHLFKVALKMHLLKQPFRRFI